MLETSDLIAFVSSSDAKRAREFYAETLGLTLEEESPFAVVFEVNGVMLRVTVVDSVQPAPYTVLGWRVDDIDATVRSLAARGVAFLRYEGMGQDTLGIWRAPSKARIAWFKDLDGNILSLTELA
ncbi:MAG: VOC family protein [Candidatus Dormibacteraeota bacterium]|nr:VOC family protein [Candidatus Dormibacteraeota bacterium]